MHIKREVGCIFVVENTKNSINLPVWVWMVESEKGAIEISNSHQTKNNIWNGVKYTVFQKANLSCNPEFINLIH